MPENQVHFYLLSDAIVAQILAFVGGFVDAAGYLKLQGVFTSSITGNLVVACASVSSLTGVICRACISIAFTLAGGLLAASAVEMKFSHQFSQVSVSIILFCVEAIALIAVWIAGMLLVSSCVPDPRI